MEELLRLGEDATEREKLDALKSAVVALNTLNRQIPGLIETGEREDLCDMFDEIAQACGLEPANYGDGQGVATEWREW